MSIEKIHATRKIRALCWGVASKEVLSDKRQFIRLPSESFPSNLKKKKKIDLCFKHLQSKHSVWSLKY